MSNLVGLHPGVPLLKVENKSAIDLSKNHIHPDISEHLDMK